MNNLKWGVVITESDGSVLSYYYETQADAQKMAVDYWKELSRHDRKKTTVTFGEEPNMVRVGDYVILNKQTKEPVILAYTKAHLDTLAKELCETIGEAFDGAMYQVIDADTKAVLGSLSFDGTINWQ